MIHFAALYPGLSSRCVHVQALVSVSKTPHHNCDKSCKEMGTFCQQAPDTTQWADTIDLTVRCDWLQVASYRMHNIVHTYNSSMLMRATRLVQVLQDLLQVLS